MNPDYANQPYMTGRSDPCQIITVCERRSILYGSDKTQPLNYLAVRGGSAKQSRRPVRINFKLNLGKKKGTSSRPESTSHSTTMRDSMAKCVQTTSRHDLEPQATVSGADFFGIRQNVIFSSTENPRASSQAIQVTITQNPKVRSNLSDNLGRHAKWIERSFLKPTLTVNKVRTNSTDSSFSKKRKEGRASYHRNAGTFDDVTRLTDYSYEIKNVGLQIKQPVVKPRLSSPKIIQRLRLLDMTQGVVRNSLFSIIG